MGIELGLQFHYYELVSLDLLALGGHGRLQLLDLRAFLQVVLVSEGLPLRNVVEKLLRKLVPLLAFAR